MTVKRVVPNISCFHKIIKGYYYLNITLAASLGTASVFKSNFSPLRWTTVPEYLTIALLFLYFTAQRRHQGCADCVFFLLLYLVGEGKTFFTAQASSSSKWLDRARPCSQCSRPSKWAVAPWGSFNGGNCLIAHVQCVWMWEPDLLPGLLQL